MIKPMPTGCITDHPAPTWCKFNFLLETVDLDDPIGYLFIVDMSLMKKMQQNESICTMKFYCQSLKNKKF